MARIIVYDGREFEDPDPSLTIDEVRHHLTNFFPELANAETKKSKRGEDDVFTFEKRVGTKGWNVHGVLTPEQEAKGYNLQEDDHTVILFHNDKEVAVWTNHVSAETIRRMAGEDGAGAGYDSVGKSPTTK